MPLFVFLSFDLGEFKTGLFLSAVNNVSKVHPTDLNLMHYNLVHTWNFRESFSYYRNLEFQSLISQLIKRVEEQIRTFVMFPGCQHGASNDKN